MTASARFLAEINFEHIKAACTLTLRKYNVLVKGPSIRVAALNQKVFSRYSDGDSYRCVASLRSELRFVTTLLNLSKRCLSPTLKRHAFELHERKVKLKQELKIRSEEEKLRVISNYSEFGARWATILRKGRNVSYRTVVPIR